MSAAVGRDCPLNLGLADSSQCSQEYEDEKSIGFSGNPSIGYRINRERRGNRFFAAPGRVRLDCPSLGGHPRQRGTAELPDYFLLESVSAGARLGAGGGNFKFVFESSLECEKRDFFEEIQRREKPKPRPLELRDYQAWLAGNAEKFERWLARL
jgi:hypothetical protein